MATASKVDTTTFTTPSDRELAMTRVFDAPRALVWDAWTSPEHVPHWLLGPEGWTMPVCEIDLRPGGAWHFVWRRSDGSEMEMHGVYREVEPPGRLVSTESWGGDWPETVNTLVLAEQDGRTTITMTILYPSKDARDAALETGMKDGVTLSFDRLAGYLAEGATPTDPSTPVTGVDFVSIPTTDLEAAMDFYGNVLGLPRSSVWQPPGAEPVGAEFETGTVTLALMVSERLGMSFQPSTVPIALHVEDVEAARADLESRGIPFRGDTIDSGVCHMANFTDPDGNALMFHHRYAPRP